MTAALLVISCYLVPAPLPPRFSSLERSGFETSQFEWTMSWHSGYDDGLVERYTTRTAGNMIWESNFGDENGYHSTVFHRRPPREGLAEEVDSAMVPKAEMAGIRTKYIGDELSWYVPNTELPVYGFVTPLKDTAIYLPLKIPGLGFSPYLSKEPYGNPFNLAPADYEDFANATFREHLDGGFPAITAEWNGGKSRLIWTFDDRQGGLPIQAAFYRADQLAGCSRTTYQQVQGYWIPKRIEFLDGENKLVRSIDVHRATVNDPAHPKEISPADIGVLPGSQFVSPKGLQWWDGSSLVSEEEFLPLLWLDPTIMDDRIAQSMVEGTGQTVEEYRARLRQSGDALRERYKREYGEELKVKKVDEEDPWVVYTNTFVKKHEFDEAAEKRARVTCDRAISLRDSLKLRDAAKIREARREGNKRKLDEIEEREKKVFERMLVKPLDKMLATFEKKKEASAKGG